MNCHNNPTNPCFRLTSQRTDADANARVPDEPTPAMLEFFERRTRQHIARVASNLTLMASVTDYTDELLGRAEIHDASKFGTEEKLPYIWLTEFRRCQNTCTPFTYPEGMEERVQAAIQHHKAVNRHHPEFHNSPDDMTQVDMIEMVCDWTAMSQELNKDGGSARGWATKTIGKSVHFNSENAAFIYQMIDKLDREIASTC